MNPDRSSSAHASLTTSKNEWCSLKTQLPVLPTNHLWLPQQDVLLRFPPSSREDNVYSRFSCLICMQPSFQVLSSEMNQFYLLFWWLIIILAPEVSFCLEFSINLRMSNRGSLVGQHQWLNPHGCYPVSLSTLCFCLTDCIHSYGITFLVFCKISPE